VTVVLLLALGGFLLGGAWALRGQSRLVAVALGAAAALAVAAGVLRLVGA